MRKNIFEILVVLVLSLSFTPIGVHPARAGQNLSAFFNDDFSGSAIDSTKWDNSFATGGVRWCTPTIPLTSLALGAPGLWQDASTTSCQGSLASPPYGAIGVGNSLATFGANPGFAFPYIWTGAPTKPSPFPNSGDFAMEIRMKYDSVACNGVGFTALRWDNTDPVGNNPPIPSGSAIFQVWNDCSGLRDVLLGGTASVPNGVDFHVYRLQYIAGMYSVLVDGVLQMGPTFSNVRPNAIWLGNPVFAWWTSGCCAWSGFSIDYVNVMVPPQIAVSKFFTDASLNPLALDTNGNPMVNVVLARGFVRSTNPGQVLAWVNVTNTGSTSLQSLKLNETLPADWTVNPPWLPGQGAIHVYLANTTSLATNPEITDPSTIAVTTGNPQTVLLSIPSLNATGTGHPLMPGQSILLSVKLSYGLVMTAQSPLSYPRNYTDTASAVAWTQPSYTGPETSATGSGFFIAYAMVVADVPVSFGSLTIRAMVSQNYWIT